jgi:hypothetical protein
VAVDTIGLYDVGDIATVTASFKSGTTPSDPTTVTARVWAPDGTATNYTVTAGQIVQDSVGAYHLDIACVLAGDYFYRFTGTGAVTAAQEGSFHVRSSTALTGPLQPTALTTLGAAREYVLRDATDGSQDAMLRRLINAYSSAVYAYTRREWLPQTTAASRRFQYSGGGFLSLEPYELRNLTSVTMYTDLPTASQRVLVAGSSTVQSEYRLHPPNRTAEGTYQWITMPQAAFGTSSQGIPSYWNNPYPYGPVGRTAPLDFEVTVLGDWGIGSVPSDVELAVLIAAKDAYENPTAYASGTIGGLQFAEEVDASTGPEARARNLPIESRALLTPYKRGSQVVVA